jgi:hypothetical protein
MRRRFWIPILLSIPITVVAVFAAFSVVWLDPGPIPNEGNRWGFAILFPFTILIGFLRRFEDGNTDFFFIAPALVQFPVYGLALAIANLKGKLRSTLIVLLVLHLLTITITLLAAKLLRPPPEANFTSSAQQIVGRERR